jgi:hypothetical protein
MSNMLQRAAVVVNRQSLLHIERLVKVK